jgi:mono/diheme cytochrome c family protein
MHLRQEIADRLAEIRKGPPASCVACHGAEAPADGNVVYGGEQGTVDFSSDVPVINLPNLNGNGGGPIEIQLGSLIQQAMQQAMNPTPDKADPTPDKGDPTPDKGDH